MLLGWSFTFHQIERRSLTRWQQWNSLAEQHGHDTNFNSIDEPGIKKATEQCAPAEEPDILSRFRSQPCYCARRAVGMISFIQSSRADNGLHSAHCWAGAR